MIYACFYCNAIYEKSTNYSNFLYSLRRTTLPYPHSGCINTISDIEVWDTYIKKIYFNAIVQNSHLTPSPLFQCWYSDQKNYWHLLLPLKLLPSQITLKRKKAGMLFNQSVQ